VHHKSSNNNNNNNYSSNDIDEGNNAFIVIKNTSAEFFDVTGMQMQLLIFLQNVNQSSRKSNFFYNNINFYIFIIVFGYNHRINVLYFLNKYTN
jgi:hypothetical protein